MLLDRTEAIQIDTDVVPYKINALDERGAVIKTWEFLDKKECWRAFYDIHDEWWSHKKKQKGLK